jgi:hypothetical protein
MAFTKIAAAGIGSTGTVTLENLIITGELNVPIITGAASTANVRTNSLVVSGVSTLGNLVATDGTFSGNVSIAGTLTYEDVTNIDSVGLITARSGVRINDGGLVVTAGVSTLASLQVGTAVTISSGIVTATSFYGDGTNLTNTGSTLSAASGSQRVVLTGQTSGTMTSSATSASLTFDASSGALSATSFSGNLSGGTVSGTTGTFSSQIQSTQANSTTTGGGQIYLNGATGNRIDFNANGVAAPTFTTRSAGTKIVLYPGIGASSVDYALGIESNTLWSSIPSATEQFRWYAATTNIATLSGGGNLTVSGTVTANSDIKLKTNIETISDALNKVLKLRGVTYDRIDSGDHQIGVIAQEIESVIPELVYESNGTKSVAYSNMVGLLIEAIKEQQKQINDLKNKINFS